MGFSFAHWVDTSWLALTRWLNTARLEEIGVALTFAVLLMLLLSIAMRWRRIRERLKKNADYRLRQDVTYSQASKRLEDLKNTIARKTKGAMIVDLVHDFSDFPLERENTPASITFEQAFEIMNTIRSADAHGPVVIILHTLGGYSLAAEFIAASLKRHPGRVKAFVPYVAMSGGTVVALAADEITLGHDAALGPIDTQYGHYPFAAYKKLYDFKKAETGDVALLNYFEAEVREQTTLDRLRNVAATHNFAAVPKLLNPALPHDRRITAADAADFNLKISTDSFPPEIYEYIETRLIMLRRYKELIVQPLQDHLREQPSREPDGPPRSNYLRRRRFGT